MEENYPNIPPDYIDIDDLYDLGDYGSDEVRIYNPGTKLKYTGSNLIYTVVPYYDEDFKDAFKKNPDEFDPDILEDIKKKWTFVQYPASNPNNSPKTDFLQTRFLSPANIIGGKRRKSRKSRTRKNRKGRKNI